MYFQFRQEVRLRVNDLYKHMIELIERSILGFVKPFFLLPKCIDFRDYRDTSMYMYVYLFIYLSI